jgi:Protein of unknown function (DUF3300)
MFHRHLRAILAGLVGALLCMLCLPTFAQEVPSGEQLEQLLAPIALYPDALLAQICAASGDPQQIIDTDNWLKQNGGLQGTALTDAAQQQGFDPAFISLVTFPTVLDAMASNIDDYAALGAAFKANQDTVMAAIQTLRQQAYASGALDSNQYQNVSVEQQDGAQVVVVQPANPQIVYVPQYQPQQVFFEGPSAGDVVAASLLSFGAGIAIGALINDQPWGWRGWGWGWGGRGMIYRNSVWGFNYRYRSPRPYYRPRPPVYNRPIHARPPPNWNQRPGYRPQPGRPGAGRPDTGRPGAGRPGIGRPGTGRPPGNIGGGRPPGNGPGVRPPGQGGRPPGNGAGTRPPGSGGGRPPGNIGGTRPPQIGGKPGNGTIARPSPSVTRPAVRNPYAGFPQGSSRPQVQRPAPQVQRPTPQVQRPAPQVQRPAPQVQRPAPQMQRPAPQAAAGGRPGAFGGNNNGSAARAASDRGRASSGAPARGRSR